MPELAELQSAFAQAVLAGDYAALADHIRPDRMRVASRIGIYRNNSISSLTALLAGIFPVVEQLGGAGFFAFSAGRFIADHPPLHPCLDLYGEEFGVFLDYFPPCAEFPYLGDMARLEWRIYRAARAPSAVPIGIEAIAALPPGQALGLRLQFDPAAYFLASPWPVGRIWHAHQAGAAEFSFDPVPCHLEIRRTDQVILRDQSAATHWFRRLLREGKTLADALEQSLPLAESFDLAFELNALFSDQLITGIIVP